MPAHTQYNSSRGIAVRLSPNHPRSGITRSRPIALSKLSTTPIELSNMNENSMVSTTTEMMEGIKNSTRNTFPSGIYL